MQAVAAPRQAAYPMFWKPAPFKPLPSPYGLSQAGTRPSGGPLDSPLASFLVSGIATTSSIMVAIMLTNQNNDWSTLFWVFGVVAGIKMLQDMYLISIS